jgi:hypothetical protein
MVYRKAQNGNWPSAPEKFRCGKTPKVPDKGVIYYVFVVIEYKGNGERIGISGDG